MKLSSCFIKVHKHAFVSFALNKDERRRHADDDVIGTCSYVVIVANGSVNVRDLTITLIQLLEMSSETLFYVPSVSCQLCMNMQFSADSDAYMKANNHQRFK